MSISEFSAGMPDESKPGSRRRGGGKPAHREKDYAPSPKSGRHARDYSLRGQDDDFEEEDFDDDLEDLDDEDLEDDDFEDDDLDDDVDDFMEDDDD